MKRFLVYLFAVMFLLGTLSGCQSNLKAGADMRAYRKEVRNLDFKDCYTEEQGYVFPNTNWEMTFSEFQEMSYSGISELYGEYDDGSATYKADNFVYYLETRKPDDILITFDAEDHLCDVSFVFTGDELTETDLTQEELITKVLEEAIKAFGTYQESAEKEIEAADGTMAATTTYTWTKEINGKTTKAEIAKIYYTGTKAPDYITLSFSNNIGEE